MRLLFICNQNLNRSKTAEFLFKDKYETRSAGLYNEKPVNSTDLSWADIIVVMEDNQRTEISKRFPKLYMQKRILCLNIPDTFLFGQERLEKILKVKMSELFEPLIE